MTHQAHGSSIVRARLTGEIEFHTMFDIKSLPSTSWLGWVEKTLEDQQWGSWHGKVLNTLCLHLKHCLAASAWARCTEHIEVVSALCHPKTSSCPVFLISLPPPLPADCVLTVSPLRIPWVPPSIPDLLSPPTFCSVPGLSYFAAEPGGAHAALLAASAWPVGQKLDPAWKQWEVTFGLSQAYKINKLFKLSTDGTEEALWNMETFFF